MTDLGLVTYYLGIIVTIDRANRIICLGQAGYVEKFIRDYDI